MAYKGYGHIEDILIQQPINIYVPTYTSLLRQLMATK